MKTQDIIKMGQAFQQVQEKKKKLDPVDKDELKGTHADRDDKDIDNDGDTDDTDKFLHKKRKAITKAMDEGDAQSADKKPEDYIDPNDGKRKTRMVPVDKQIVDKDKEMKKESTGFKILDRIMEKAKVEKDLQTNEMYADYKSSPGYNDNDHKQFSHHKGDDKRSAQYRKAEHEVSHKHGADAHAIGHHKGDTAVEHEKSHRDFSGSSSSDHSSHAVVHHDGTHTNISLPNSKKATAAHVTKQSEKVHPNLAADIAHNHNEINFHESVQMPDENKKMALQKALQRVSAPSEKGKKAVTLPKAPFDIPKKEKKGEETAKVNPKLEKKKGDAEVAEGANQELEMHTDYARPNSVNAMREAMQQMWQEAADRKAHYKGATEPEDMKDNRKGKGAQDMMKAADDAAANPDKTVEKGMDDVAKAGRAGPSMKARRNDNMKGDKNIINKIGRTT